MNKRFWPNVEGEFPLAAQAPDPDNLWVAVRYGVIAAEAKTIPPDDVKRIKSVIERLSEGRPDSSYTNSVLEALSQKIEPRGWESKALAD